MQDLYHDSHVSIFFAPGSGVLHTHWKGYPSFDNCKDGAEQVLKQLQACRATKVLNDNTEVRGLWLEGAEWAARFWFPRMREAGMRRFAWVYSPARFAQISADTAMVCMNPNDFGVRAFHSREDALNWLLCKEMSG